MVKRKIMANLTKSKKFTSAGVVIGNCWGGGSGVYPAEKLQANSKAELLKIANNRLVKGSLDSGFGFESLRGAVLGITTITTVIIDGKAYVNKEYESEIIGIVSDDELEQIL